MQDKINEIRPYRAIHRRKSKQIFVGNVAIGMSVTVNNETRVIASITNNDTLTVTSAFTNSAQDKYLTTNQSYDYRVVTLTKDLG